MRFPGIHQKKDISYRAVEIDANRSDTNVSNQTAPAEIRGWPAEPQRIASAPLWIISDFLLLLVPVAFIALAALAYKLDGTEVSDRGLKIQQATLLGPTLYPLGFAALGGRSLKKIALWRAQEGTTLGFLDHVIGSQTLVATVGYAFTVRSLNFLTLGLMAMWALSPLGGQSALRLLHVTNSTLTDNRPVFYANVDSSSRLPIGGNNVDDFNRVNSVVSTSLMTADTLEPSPVDTWNHPKIPRIQELEKAEDMNDTGRMWYTTPQHMGQSYASLTGVNVINLAQDGFNNFTIPYEYMYFDCGLSPANNFTTRVDPENGRSETMPDFRAQYKFLQDLNNAGQLDSANQFPPKSNMSIAPAQPSGSYRDFFFYTKGRAAGEGPIKPEALLYGSRMVGLTYYLFECSMKSVMVEANVLCEGSRCWVERLRRLHIDRAERSGTALPYDIVNNGMYSRFFIQYLAHIGGENGNAQNNPVDAYINGLVPWSTVSLAGTGSTKNWTEYIDNPDKTMLMSHRLTRLMNTYWDASRWPQAMTRNDPWGLSSINKTSGEPIPDMTMNRTEAITTHQVPIYRANVGWVACLVICSGVLLLLGLFSVFLSLRIVVPDIFDHVSSFTRDNPYVNSPPGGSSMGGAERAKLLRKLPVQLGDVDTGAETGYIAVRSVGGAKDCVMGRVRKDRMYR